MAVAAYAIAISFAVLLFFIVGGQFLLEALKIPMSSFQLAGSLVLLLFGLKMVLGHLSAEIAAVPADASLIQRAVYPLAVPGIAGAGAILTVVLLTDNHTRSLGEQAATTGVLVVCLAGFFALYAGAGLVSRLLGRTGIEIISRVFGLILSSIAVHGLVVAAKLSFSST